MSERRKNSGSGLTNIGYAVSALGIIAILLHWPGSRFWLLLGILLIVLGMVSDWMGFNIRDVFKPKLSRKETLDNPYASTTPKNPKAAKKQSSKNQYERISKVLYYLGFGIVGLGLFFRVMHWPGGNFFLVIGAPAIAVWFILSAFQEDDD